MVTDIWVASRLLKKTHMLRCAQSPRSNVPPKYASARRFFARLASEIFLTSLQTDFCNNPLAVTTLEVSYRTMVQTALKGHLMLVP